MDSEYTTKVVNGELWVVNLLKPHTHHWPFTIHDA